MGREETVLVASETGRAIETETDVADTGLAERGWGRVEAGGREAGAEEMGVTEGAAVCSVCSGACSCSLSLSLSDCTRPLCSCSYSSRLPPSFCSFSSFSFSSLSSSSSPSSSGPAIDTTAGADCFFSDALSSAPFPLGCFPATSVCS